MLGRTSLCAKMKLVGPSSQGETFFFAKYGGPSGRSQQLVGKCFFREILVAHPVGPCCQVEESLFCA